MADTGEICLDPFADIWRLPGHGVLTSSPRGIAFHEGPIAEEIAIILASGPQPAHAVFQKLSHLAEPPVLMTRLDALRKADLLTIPVDGLVAPLGPETLTEVQGARHSKGRLHLEFTAQTILLGPFLSSMPEAPCPDRFVARRAEHDDLAHLLAARKAQLVQTRQITERQRVLQKTWLKDALASLSKGPDGLIKGLSLTDHRPFEAHAPTPCGSPESVEDPVTGIIRGYAVQPSAPGLSELQQTVLAQHAFPLARPTPEETIRNRQGRSAGKGRTMSDARFKAKAEAVERYAGLYRPDRAGLTSADLDAPVISPDQWLGFHADQYAWASQGLGRAAWVPDRRDPGQRTEWTEVTEWQTGATGYAPAALCWHQYPAASAGRADSNGCAAGQTRAHAMGNALLELIERDAVGLWWWPMTPCPRVPLGLLDDPWLHDVCTAIALRGFTLSLRDLTSDLGVPVSAAIAWPLGNTGPLCMGFGAGGTLTEAATHATEELLQGFPLETSAEIGGDPECNLASLPYAHTPPDALGFLRPDQGPVLDQLPAPTATDADALSDRLTAKGFRVWMLDQSRKDIPFPVVRAIVPGLCHMYPRLGHSRLGFENSDLSRAVLEGRLNPYLIPE